MSHTTRALLSVCFAAAAGAQTLELTYAPRGAVNRLGFYEAQTCALSTSQPAYVTKLPAGVADPLFGMLLMGPRENQGRYAVLLSNASTNNATLYIDANGDGDLTNDPAPEWKQDQYSNPSDGRVLIRQRGGAMLTMKYDSGTREGAVQFYRMDPRDPARSNAKNQFIFYRDYGLEGKATIGDLTYKAFLSDDLSSGDYRGKTPPSRTGVTLYIDVNGNNRFDRKDEAFDPNKPIVIGERTLELRKPAADGTGATLSIVKNTGPVKQPVKETDKPTGTGAGTGSGTGKGARDVVKEPSRGPGDGAPNVEPGEQPAPETKPEPKPEAKPAPKPAEKPNLAVGGLAPEFTQPDLDGKTISFPGDYKGKLVLLDFWATWCKPCRDEIPHVVAAYGAWHERGLEVIGISLDRADKKDALRSFTETNKMPWKQVYDGGYWQAAVAKTYEVRSIPAMFLIDGDSGRIVASGNDLRGKKLERTIEKAMKAKKAH